MSVAGYEKVKTKVIEGKKKCIYKKYKGTKLYVKGFGKMRSVESYIKLCKKSAAAKAAKASKPTKAKKARSKSTKKYGGFLQELFSNMDGDNFANEEKKKGADKFTTSSMMTGDADTKPASKDTFAAPPSSHPPAKTGGSNCSRQGGYRGGNGAMTGLSQGLSQGLSAFTGTGGYRGGNVVDQFQDDSSEQFQDQSQSQDGGRRRKRNRAAKSMLDKLMMAATFRKRSAKKGKKLRRKGGNLVDSAVINTATALDTLSGGIMGGKKYKGKKGNGKKGGSSQTDY
jgi:hypothetical protein